MQTNTLILGDCLEKIKEMQENSVDAIITDPPYGIKFTGKKWDCDVPSVEIWQECLRGIKAKRAKLLRYCNCENKCSQR